MDKEIAVNLGSESAEGSSKAPSMSPLQKEISEGGGFLKYVKIQVGDRGVLSFVFFELYHMLVMSVSGALGLILRRVLGPLFLKSCGKGLVIGKSVVLRQPGEIEIGNNVVVEDYSTLEVRSKNNSKTGIRLADHSFIGRNTIVVAKQGYIHLDRAVNIGSHCRIATQSMVEIGESTLVAAYSYIGPGNHKIADDLNPIIEQGMENKGGVKIGANCWIGTRATILDGVTIGDNSVVGAHSLVTKNVPPNTIVAGVPARELSKRFEQKS